MRLTAVTSNFCVSKSSSAQFAKVLFDSSEKSFMMLKPIPERRRFPRAHFSFAAVIEWENYHLMGRISNIGIDGLYIRLKHCGLSINNGESVIVTIYLDGRDQHYSIFQLNGRILRIDEEGVGVQFSDMTRSDHDRLNTLIEFMSVNKTRCNDRAFMQFQLALLSLGSIIGDLDKEETMSSLIEAR